MLKYQYHMTEFTERYGGYFNHWSVHKVYDIVCKNVQYSLSNNTCVL